jgi:hypothetical protein
MKSIIFFFIRLYRWFVPQDKWRTVPNRLISPYEFIGATEQERLLMLAGAARSPLDARQLLTKYETEIAADVLEQLPAKRKPGFKHRWKLLLRRFDGHDTSNPYERFPDDGRKIRVWYRLKLDNHEKPNHRN